MPCAPVVRHGFSAFSRIRRNTLCYCALRLPATVPYVERTPVAARLCRRAKAWPWSSAAAHLRGHDDGLVEVRPMLTLVDGREAYLSDPCDEEIAAHIKKHSGTGRPLGDERFVRSLERITGGVLRRRRLGPKHGMEER